MVVFLDLFFLENVIVDGFLLTLTMQTIKVKTNNFGLLCASVFGSIYSILCLLVDMSFISSFPFKIIIAFIMNFIFFRKKEILFQIKSTIIFILYSMLLAGICIFIQCSVYMEDNFTLTISDYHLGYQLLSLMTIYILIQRVIIYVKDRKSIGRFIYDIEIETKDFKKIVKGFLDTGNELREPVTNLPVIILERNVFEGINIDDYAKLLIPYKVINGRSGNLKAFKPESVKIKLDEKCLTCSAIVALCENRLSSLGDYNALLSRGLLYS